MEGCLLAGDGGFEPLLPRDMAVLVRDWQEAAAIRRALDLCGVRSVYLSDKDSVFASQEAQDLVRWLDAVLYAEDNARLRLALATATLGLDYAGLDRLFNGSSRQMGVTPALRLPIFDGGRLRAQLGGRAAELDAAIAQYNGAVLDAVKQAGDAIASVQSLQRQQQLQTESLSKAERAYDFAVQRYQAGLGSQITVLNTETQLINQRRLAVDLQARELDTRVALAAALGGGWSDDTSAVAVQ